MFKVGDIVEVVDLGPYATYVDGRTEMLGKTVTIIMISEKHHINFNIKTDYDGGWWVNAKALAHSGGLLGKTPIERKIAFMYKRFKERNNV